MLSKIVKGEYSAVVCSVNAACQKTMPPAYLESLSLEIKDGEMLDVDKTAERLVAAGYSRYDQVDGTSQFAIRGGIIDVFPPGAAEPARIELWGDVIDGIASFDIATQRRTGSLDKIDIIPANEVLFKSNEKFAKSIEALADSLKGKAIKARENLYADAELLKNGGSLPCNDKYLPLAYESNGIFDYLNGLLFVCESGKVKEKVGNQQKLMDEQIKWYLESGNLCKGIDKFTIDFDELKEIYSNSGAVYLDSLPRGSFDTPVSHLASFTIQSFNAWNGTMEQLSEDIKPLYDRKYTICIMAGTSRACKALQYDLNEAGFDAVYFEKMPEEFPKGTVSVVSGSLNAGFQISDLSFALITHTKAVQKKKKNKSVNSKNAIHSLDELSVGDYIVHNVHGIGVFEGIHALELNKVKKDYIKIAYDKGDTLNVPVTQLDLVSKYIGPKEARKVK
ncbi:MAG: transcription-repair coupling factor, partial [Eubacterium sp.]|nr:transcription-repair coupling factor [Eubacterium sp.]